MHDHIQRLKLKIRDMEVATLANKARLKASEDRLEHQQRINDGNACCAVRDSTDATY